MKRDDEQRNVRREIEKREKDLLISLFSSDELFAFVACENGYTHVGIKGLSKIKSPLDLIKGGGV